MKLIIGDGQKLLMHEINNSNPFPFVNNERTKKMGDLKTIDGTSMAEVEEKRSKFIANAFYVRSVKEAEEILIKIKKKYYDARHNCYAYIIKEDTVVKKSSDDGEPSRYCRSSYFKCTRKKQFMQCASCCYKIFWRNIARSRWISEGIYSISSKSNRSSKDSTRGRRL